MNLTALEAFSGNHIWMIDDAHRAIVADPGGSRPLEAALDAPRLEWVGILWTGHRAHDGTLPSIDFR